MPKPMLGKQSKQHSVAADPLSFSEVREQRQKDKELRQQKIQNDGITLARLLRKPRSEAYMETLRQLDAGGHVQNQAQVDEIIDGIRREFPEVQLYGVLLGIVSRCHLGDNYEVHTLDFEGEVIHHYLIGESMPEELESARNLVLWGGYPYVEVYEDCYRAISYNGTVSLVKR